MAEDASVYLSEGDVQVERLGKISTVSFFHPKSNSLPGRVLKKLAEAIKTEGHSPEVHVVVLRSEGEKAFCAGASFDELLSLDNRADADAFFMGFAHVINACRTCPVPIVGRVQGKAVGGGVGLAASVDYCFATQGSQIKLSELAVGIGPFVVGPAVERKMGLSAYSDMAFNATEWKSAEWAREKGLFMEVFAGVAELDSAVMALAERLANSSRDALTNIKKVCWAGTENWDGLLQERAGISGRLILEPTARAILQQLKG